MSEATPFDHFVSVFFVLGLITITAFAWQRFDEPSFPTADTLPHADEPLRFLFLRDSYNKARWVYVAAVLGIYILFVMPGQDMAKALELLGLKEFPPQAWALVVALLFAGLLPNSNLKFVTMIEGWLRRLIHRWFLVPDGVQRTIGILKNADYNIPEGELTSVAKQIRDDLKRQRRSLRHRWARATMLMESLSPMGATLPNANFEPFQDDFEDISARYKALGQEIAGAADTDQKLSGAVDKLLNRIYAYISWGVRYQADSQQEVDEMLKKLGFDIPDLGDRRLFDIVAPPILLVTLITAVFWVSVDGISRKLGASDITLSDSVLNALISATAASFMYGCAVFIALNKRADQIERNVWLQGSMTRLAPIAVKAGVMTCLVIIVTTVVLRLPDTLKSLAELAKLVVPHSDAGTAAAAISAAGTAAAAPAAGTTAAVVRWDFLPVRIAMALPWVLAGGTVSILLAYFLGGEVRRTDMAYRLRDARVMGIGLGLSVAAAQLIQMAIADRWAPGEVYWPYVPLVGFAGFLCGAVIGYMVPRACRDNLLTPTDPAMARLLRKLLTRAQSVRGSEQEARDWAFSPHNELRGLTPAEAVQYERLQPDVWRLLDGEARMGKSISVKVGDQSVSDDRGVVSAVPSPAIVPAE
jgi:hypothetical protein